LVALTITVGSVNQTDFINILIVLLTIAGSLYFTFFPSPSAKRGATAIVAVIVVASIVLDKPLGFRTWATKILSTREVSVGKVAPPVPVGKVEQPATTPSSTTLINTPGTYTAVGCGDTRSATLEVTLPATATEVTYSAVWKDQSNVKSSTQSARQEGNRIIVTGTITGLDRQWIFGIPNCPGGGHATLSLMGSYKIAG
jgi:hypothetical protein